MSQVTTGEKKVSTTGFPHEEHRAALENVRKQMVVFGNQLHEYFQHTQAEVENYKFTVEKHGEGIEVELLFKAYVHPKISEAAKIIPK